MRDVALYNRFRNTSTRLNLNLRKTLDNFGFYYTVVVVFFKLQVFVVFLIKKE